MSYQVLARKWRPRLFTELIGQEHVVRALVNALDNDRLHHAYLFTGTRGVGKTTVARIFAKALNCERGVGSSPCGECAACRELDEGRFVDLLEVDAASRTKVEDTRDLLDYSQYAPTRGRYKVYLIDEVHMLSKHSFNALLKTLEEPPPHVKFLLATTDPQRLPVTILSRCLQFGLRRLAPELIASHLAAILGHEDIAADAAALDCIARAADGSVRDALSLLDQAIAYGGGRLVEAEVRSMLGTIDRNHVLALLEALAAGDGAALLDGVARAAEQSIDFSELLDEIASALQRIAVVQIVPQSAKGDDGDGEQFVALAGAMGREDVQLWYQIAIMGRRDLPYSPDARTGVEMTLLRMLAFRPGEAGAVAPPPADRPAAASRPTGTAPKEAGRTAAGPGPRPEAPVAAPGGGRREAPTASGSRETPVVAPGSREAPDPSGSGGEGSAVGGRQAAAADDEWDTLCAALGLQGITRELAFNCALAGRDGDRMRLVLDRAHGHLRSPAAEERLQQALAERLGASVVLEISVGEPPRETPAARRRAHDRARQEAALSALEHDAEVRALRDVFDARIIPDSVQPVD